MDSKTLKLDRRGILPGYADGRYEAAPTYDASEFARAQREDPLRRDNRVSVRVSGQDLNALQRMALAEGLPLQSLLAQIIHQYAMGQLERVDAVPGPAAIQTAQAPSLDERSALPKPR